MKHIWCHQWRWVNIIKYYSIVHWYILNCKRGIHEIEHQITYEGSNFIFHDSQGFESGARKELEVVWDFIEKRSAAAQLKNQLHAIWYLWIYSLCEWLNQVLINRYCIPMDSPRPILPTELEFFNKGTGKGKSDANQYLWPGTACWCINTICSSLSGCIHQIWWSTDPRIWKIEWHRG